MRGAVAEAYVEAQENAKFSGLRAPATKIRGPHCLTQCGPFHESKGRSPDSFTNRNNWLTIR